MIKRDVSFEEKLLINILFNEKVINKDLFKKTNYDLFIKIISEHHLIPSIYYNSRVKNYLRYYPVDLNKYIKEIFEINKERNKVLVKESLEFSRILYTKNINHVFIKGAAYILGNLYDDIGVRMIGDIDFLIEKNYEQEIIQLFDENGYKVSDHYNYFETRHIQRRVNKDKLFALEAHTRLFDRKKDNYLISDFLENNNTYLPKYDQQLNYNILSWQINDYGSCKMNYNYKNLYDTYLLIKKSNTRSFNENKYIKNYFIPANFLQIPNLDKFYKDDLNLNLIRFKLKYSSSFFRRIDNIIFKFYKILISKPAQAKKIFKSGGYRMYILKKLIDFTLKRS